MGVFDRKRLCRAPGCTAPVTAVVSAIVDGKETPKLLVCDRHAYELEQAAIAGGMGPAQYIRGESRVDWTRLGRSR